MPEGSHERPIDVAFHFDFVSPYAWLALMRAPAFAAEHAVRFDLRPVVYARLLDAHGLTGPGETDVKRRHMLADVVRCAEAEGVAVVGPPNHPFRSLEALRVATVLVARLDPDHALAACRMLADAAWGSGVDLAEPHVLRGLVEEIVEKIAEEIAEGIAGGTVRAASRTVDPADELLLAAGAPGTKQALRDATERAVADGVFGVPMFSLARDDCGSDADSSGTMHFWGHDRMEHLAAELAARRAGTTTQDHDLVQRMCVRPAGVTRRGAPRR